MSAYPDEEYLNQLEAEAAVKPLVWVGNATMLEMIRDLRATKAIRAAGQAMRDARSEDYCNHPRHSWDRCVVEHEEMTEAKKNWDAVAVPRNPGRKP